MNRGVHTYGRILCVPVPVFCNKQIFSPLVCHTSELVKYGSSSLAAGAKQNLENNGEHTDRRFLVRVRVPS